MKDNSVFDKVNIGNSKDITNVNTYNNYEDLNNYQESSKNKVDKQIKENKESDKEGIIVRRDSINQRGRSHREVIKNKILSG